MKRFELVSFEVCSYVQRPMITLKRKNIDFDLTFINLENPPAWFTRISPLGKVPVLIVRDDEPEPTVLFESSVINEYLDEIAPPASLPADPLAKARARAWVSVSDDLIGALFHGMTSGSRADAEPHWEEIWRIFVNLENALPGGDTFTGADFSLVDAAFAPFFMRTLMFRALREDPRWAAFPKVRRWAEALRNLPCVRESVVPDFAERFATFLRNNGSGFVDELGWRDDAALNQKVGPTFLATRHLEPRM